MQQAVAEPFGFGFGEVAVEGELAESGEQVVGAHGGGQPGGVCGEGVRRELGQSGGRVVADLAFKQAWRVAEGLDRIIRQDVLDAVPLAQSELDAGFFRVRMDRATDAQRAYLAAMAAMGPGPHRSGDVAAALGKQTTQVGPVRHSLIQRGLCYSPRHDVIAFTVPMFGEFVRRHIA